MGVDARTELLGAFETFPGKPLPHGPHVLLGAGGQQLAYLDPYFAQQSGR